MEACPGVFYFLDAGYDAKTICEILDIGPTVLNRSGGFLLQARGCRFWALKGLQPTAGSTFSFEQERATRLSQEHSARTQMRLRPNI